LWVGDRLQATDQCQLEKDWKKLSPSQQLEKINLAHKQLDNGAIHISVSGQVYAKNLVDMMVDAAKGAKPAST
jgi:hypothetical protein